jgi:hypothetical protein
MTARQAKLRPERMVIERCVTVRWRYMVVRRRAS